MARPSFFLRCGFELKKLQFVETKCQQHLVGTGNPEFVSSVLGIRIQSNHTDAVAQTGLSNLHHFTSPEVLRLRVWCGKAQIQILSDTLELSIIICITQIWSSNLLHRTPAAIPWPRSPEDGTCGQYDVKLQASMKRYHQTQPIYYLYFCRAICAGDKVYSVRSHITNQNVKIYTVQHVHIFRKRDGQEKQQ